MVSSVGRLPWRGSGFDKHRNAVLDITSIAVALAEALAFATMMTRSVVMALAVSYPRASPLS